MQRSLSAIAELLVIIIIITVRMHVMQCTVLSVRPYDCLYIKRVYCDKTKETCAHILILYERTFILVFRHEERLVGDDL